MNLNHQRSKVLEKNEAIGIMHEESMRKICEKWMAHQLNNGETNKKNVIKTAVEAEVKTGSSVADNVESFASARRVMDMIFWDAQGIIYTLEKITVTGEYHTHIFLTSYLFVIAKLWIAMNSLYTVCLMDLKLELMRLQNIRHPPILEA